MCVGAPACACVHAGGRARLLASSSTSQPCCWKCRELDAGHACAPAHPQHSNTHGHVRQPIPRTPLSRTHQQREGQAEAQRGRRLRGGRVRLRVVLAAQQPPHEVRAGRDVAPLVAAAHLWEVWRRVLERKQRTTIAATPTSCSCTATRAPLPCCPPPLAPPHLHAHAVLPAQVHKVVALQQLVRELGEGDAALALQPRAHLRAWTARRAALN